MTKTADNRKGFGKAGTLIVVLLIVLLGFFLIQALKQGDSQPDLDGKHTEYPADVSDSEIDYIEVQYIEPHLLEQLEAAKEAINSQKMEEGSKLLAPILEELPDHPELIFEQAKILRWQGDEQKAIDSLKNLYPRLRNSDDVKYYALCLCSDILISQVDHDLAKELVAKAAKLRPDYDWHKQIQAHLDEIRSN